VETERLMHESNVSQLRTQNLLLTEETENKREGGSVPVSKRHNLSCENRRESPAEGRIKGRDNLELDLLGKAHARCNASGQQRSVERGYQEEGGSGGGGKGRVTNAYHAAQSLNTRTEQIFFLTEEGLWGGKRLGRLCYKLELH